jgi:hypothetical protein
MIHPAANAALVIAEFSDHFGDFDVGELAARLKAGMKDVSKNDLRSCEAMLYCQAHALQAIFVDSLLQVNKRFVSARGEGERTLCPLEAAVVGLGRGIDVLGVADRQGAKVRLRSTPSAG